GPRERPRGRTQEFRLGREGARALTFLYSITSGELVADTVANNCRASSPRRLSTRSARPATGLTRERVSGIPVAGSQMRISEGSFLGRSVPCDDRAGASHIAFHMDERPEPTVLREETLAPSN